MPTFRAFALLLIFSSVALPSLSWAQTIHGVFRVVKGDIKVISKSGQETKAKIGQKVFPSDRIRAGVDSRAKIVMVDKNELNISPDSEIVIENYQFKPEENKKNVLINVLYGKVRTKVEQKYDGENKFQIKTPTAVAGVRGTDFITGFNRIERRTLIITFEGKVEFGQLGPGGAILNPVIVKVGETTSVVGNAPPAPPIEIPQNELQEMDKNTDAAKAPAPSAQVAPNQGPQNQANNEDKKTNGTGPEPKTAASPPPRTPASVGPIAGGGNMLRPEDMPSAGPVAPPLPSLMAPPPMPNMMLPPPQTAVNDIIQTQQRNLIISITNGP